MTNPFLLGIIQVTHISTWISKILTLHCLGASLVAQTVKNLPAMQETKVRSQVGKVPWGREWLPTPVFSPGEPHGQSDRLQFIWLQRVVYNWAANTSTSHYLRKCKCRLCWVGISLENGIETSSDDDQVTFLKSPPTLFILETIFKISS